MGILQLNTTISQEDIDNAGSFKPVPAGTYTAFIYEIEVNKVQNGGRYDGLPRLKFTFKIADGETAEDGTDVSGKRLWHDVNAFEVWSEKNQKFFPPFELIEIGKAIGMSPEEINSLDTDEWTGKELQLNVQVVPKRVKTADGKYVDSTDPEEKTNSVGRFRSLKSAATASAAKRPAAKAKTASKAGGLTL